MRFLNNWEDQTSVFRYDGAGQHVSTWRPNRVWSDYIYYSDRFLRAIRHQLNWGAQMHLYYQVRPNGDRKIAVEDFSTQTTRSQTQTRTGQGVTFPKGPWTDTGGYKQTTKWGSVMEIAYTGDGALLTIGTGPDHGMIDISINGWFWRSFNGYEERVGEKVIELPKVVKPDDAATGKVSIEVRSDNHHQSTGRVFRFKQIEVITVVSEDRHHVDAISYGYDGLNRLTQADGATDHTYAYDRSGNLTSKDGTARTYNAANQLTAIGNRNLTYDANGNLTSDGTNTYTWDRANRLTQVGNTTYTYDGLGNRVSQTVNTTKTDYLLDLQSGLPKVLAATTGTNTERYIHAIRGLHATEDSNGNWTYALEDALGSVRGTIGSGRQFQSTHNYDPYGHPAGNYGAGFGYAGEQIDSNGLSYNRARYYDPRLSVFNSLDPYPGTMARPMSLNGYAYVEGNTPNRTDPTGMASRVRSLTQGGSVIRPPAVKTSPMRNSLVCRTPAASFAQTGSVGVGMPVAPAVRVAHRSSPAASGAICCVGAPPIVFCYDCSAFPPIIPTFEPDDYEDALTEMLNVIDTVSASAFHVVINATNLQILFYNLNPFLPDLPKIPDIDTIVDWAKGELGLTSESRGLPWNTTLEKAPTYQQVTTQGKQKWAHRGCYRYCPDLEPTDAGVSTNKCEELQSRYAPMAAAAPTCKEAENLLNAYLALLNVENNARCRFKHCRWDRW